MQSIRYKYSLFTLLALLFAGILLLVLPEPTHAVTTVPTTMNFQGRLTNSAGNILSDGSYNVTFRLYTVSSGGTAVWTEARDTTNRIAVTNGLFSVQLGSVTPLPASLFASGNLYLEVELPSPATATCSTAACASYTEGPMTPRNQLATSAYSYNSETLDGLDSSAFVQQAASNTFTSDNLIKTTSVSALQIQNASATPLFVADTSNSRVYIGNPSGDTTGALLVLDTKTSSGDPTGLNGGMYYNSNTGDFRCYVAGGWQSCQAHSANVKGQVTAANTYTGTTYANLPAPSSISYTKLGGANTNLAVTLTTSFYVLASTTSAKIGINVDGVDYDCGFMYFNQANIYVPLSCSVVIPSVTAGVKTIQARWKVNGASGSLNIGANTGWNSMTVIETN